MTPYCGGYAYLKRTQMDDWGISIGIIDGLASQLGNQIAIVRPVGAKSVVNKHLHCKARLGLYKTRGTTYMPRSTYIPLHKSMYMLTKRQQNWLLGYMPILCYGMPILCYGMHNLVMHSGISICTLSTGMGLLILLF